MNNPVKEIDSLIEKLETFQREVDELVLATVEENKELVLDMNTETQLFEQGINSKGEKINPPYTPYTVKIKRILGQPTNRVTLRNEGDFHSKFYLKRAANEIEISSTDEKTEALVDKYGKEIFGLTRENLEELSEHYIKPALEKKLNEIIK